VSAWISQLRPAADVWAHVKAGHVPELPPPSPLGVDLDCWAPHRLPEYSTCPFYSLVFLDVYLGERVREKRERKSKRSLQSQLRDVYKLCLRHHVIPSLSCIPQV